MTSDTFDFEKIIIAMGGIRKFHRVAKISHDITGSKKIKV